jgi:hypothetical protein
MKPQDTLTEILQSVDEDADFTPPDNNDYRWTTGVELFTRQEVANILWSQIAMIGNDLKTNCGKDLTKDMYTILDNPRIPKF